MTVRSALLSAAIALGMTIPLTLAQSVATAPSAHASSSAAPKVHKGIPSRCKTTVKPKGVVKFSDWQFPANLNPYTPSALVEVYVENAMGETLFTYNQKGKLIPQLATALPTQKNGGIKDGGKTLIVHLKQGNRWSNGSEFTSADIKFGLAVGLNKASGPVCSGSCDVVKRIDTPDRYTAVFHLKHVYAPVVAYGIPPLIPHKWHSSSGSWTTPVQAAKLIYGTPEYNFETSDYPTNGPYQVSQYVLNDRVTFKPMKYYRNMSCGAKLKTLIFAFYSDKPGLIAAAANHDTDVTGGGGGYTLADEPALKAHKSKYKVSSVPSFSQEHLEFNLDSQYKGKPNPVANAKVRQALALALDKSGLIQAALNLKPKTVKSIIAWSPWVLTPTLVQPFADKDIKGQWDPIAKKYTNTPGRGKALADAKKLLSQTPYKNGFDLEFVTSSGNPVRTAQAGVVLNNWKRLGVNINVTYSPASRLFTDWDTGSELNHGAFQVAMFGFTGAPDPDQTKYNLDSNYIDREKKDHSSPLNANYSGIHNKKIDTAFDRGAGSTDPKVRRTNYYLIQTQVNQNAYWIPLYFRPSIATADSVAKNVVVNPTQAGPTWNVAVWKTAS